MALPARPPHPLPLSPRGRGVTKRGAGVVLGCPRDRGGRGIAGRASRGQGQRCEAIKRRKIGQPRKASGVFFSSRPACDKESTTGPAPGLSRRLGQGSVRMTPDNLTSATGRAVVVSTVFQETEAARRLGLEAYSYPFAARAFLPLL